MASQQDVRAKVLHAEEAARTAADELHDVNKQRTADGRGTGEVAVEHHETRTDENRPGIIGSIFQTVTGTLGGAKDAVIGKTHEDTDKASVVSKEAAERERRNSQPTTRKAAEYEDAASRKAEDTKDYTGQKVNEAADKAAEYKDYTAQKARETADKAAEYKEYTAQKARETADAAARKAQEAKDTTVGKMREYKDYAAEKTKETADATAQKAKEAKDYTVDKAKEAKDYTADKVKGAKDYTIEKTKEAGDRAAATKDYTAEKAKEGKDGAVGKLSELKDNVMGFFSGNKYENRERMSSETVGGHTFTKGALDEAEEDARRKMETMRLKEQGYEARGTQMDTSTRGGRGGGEEVVSAKTTVAVDRMGNTAEALRKADQMTGQAFNDVGGMDAEEVGRSKGGGVYRVQLKHEKK